MRNCSSSLPPADESTMSSTPAYPRRRASSASVAPRSRSRSSPDSRTCTSAPANAIDAVNASALASGIAPVASRHMSPSCSLVYARSAGGASSTVTSPTFGAATSRIGPAAPPARDTIG